MPQLFDTIRCKPWRGAFLVLAASAVLMFCGDRFVAAQAKNLDAGIKAFSAYVTLAGDSRFSLALALALLLTMHGAAKLPSQLSRREKLLKVRQISLFLFLAVAISGVACDLLKMVFGRPRPRMWLSEGLYDFHFFQLRGRMTSFPSGHSTTAFALATALTCLRPRWWPAWFLAAGLVAMTRVALGEHYPSDVVVGGYLGIVSTVYLHAWWFRPATPSAVNGDQPAEHQLG